MFYINTISAKIAKLADHVKKHPDAHPIMVNQVTLTIVAAAKTAHEFFKGFFDPYS